MLDAQYATVATQVRPHGLSDAILKGDLSAAKVLIEKGIDVEEQDTRTGHRRFERSAAVELGCVA